MSILQFQRATPMRYVSVQSKRKHHKLPDLGLACEYNSAIADARMKEIERRMKADENKEALNLLAVHIPLLECLVIDFVYRTKYGFVRFAQSRPRAAGGDIMKKWSRAVDTFYRTNIHVLQQRNKLYQINNAEEFLDSNGDKPIDRLYKAISEMLGDMGIAVDEQLEDGSYRVGMRDILTNNYMSHIIFTRLKVYYDKVSKAFNPELSGNRLNQYEFMHEMMEILFKNFVQKVDDSNEVFLFPEGAPKPTKKVTLAMNNLIRCINKIEYDVTD